MCRDPGLLTEDPLDSGPGDLVSVVKDPFTGPHNILYMRFGILTRLVSPA